MSNKHLFLRLILSIALLQCVYSSADTLKLAPQHPDQYVVVKGDTLWDISARFLQDPWRWPDIWQINPEIKNPHLIYPGDIIRLEYVEGKPALKLERVANTPTDLPTVKLSPSPRYSSLETAIPTIPVDAIKQFLSYPRIVSEDELEASPYILATAEGHLISGTGDKVYARGFKDSDLRHYNIIRRGQTYRDPANPKHILGYEAVDIGAAEMTETGDPSTLVITQGKREILKGDRLVPAEEAEFNQYFTPHAPKSSVNGQIIAVLDGVSRIGRYQTVVINSGKADGLEIGDVLAVYQTGDVVRDNIGSGKNSTIKLPNERAGALMLVRLFDNISYALVMEAARDLRVHDTVVNP